MDSLAALPPLKAITQSALPARALSSALIDPDSMDSAFCQSMFALYQDIFMEAPEIDAPMTLPAKALLIRGEVDPRAKRVFRGLVSIIGGSLLLGLKIAGVE